MKFILPIIVFFSFCFWGCDIINPKEEVPTYIHIDSFQFVPRGDTFGSSSHKITNVLAYLDNQLIGGFELPCTFPVLTKGKPGLLSIEPGIYYDGDKGFLYPYPFYKFDTMTLIPQPAVVINFAAKTSYTDQAKKLFNDNFDFGNSFVKINNGDTSLITLTRAMAPDYVFEGNASGYIYLSAPNQISENISQSSFKPEVGVDAYVELDYKCSIPFLIGVAAFFPNGTDYKEYVGGINPRPDSWNKIYISIKDFVSGHQGDRYYLLVRAGTDKGQPNGWIAIDNIKVISY